VCKAAVGFNLYKAFNMDELIDQMTIPTAATGPKAIIIISHLWQTIQFSFTLDKRSGIPTLLV
jgi:hypothetical protein